MRLSSPHTQYWQLSGTDFCGKNWLCMGSPGDCLYLVYKQMPLGMRELFI